MADYIHFPNGPTYADRTGGPAYGGRGMDMYNDAYVWGTSEADDDVRRYRSMAERRATAPWIDTRQSDQARDLSLQSRGQQMGSLGMLEAGARGQTADTQILGAAAGGQTQDMRLLGDAAAGQAPSRAEILGNRMMDRSLGSQVSAAGNVRGGPGASAAAFRATAQGAAQQRADMTQGIQAERASELAGARRDYAGAMGNARSGYSNAMGAARGQYFGATTDIRGQDIGTRAQDLGQATSQAQLEAQERARATQQEQFYEKMASDTRFGVLQAEQNNYFGDMKNRLDQRAMNNAEAAASWNKLKDVAGAGAGAVTGGFSYAAGAAADAAKKASDDDNDTSDVRAKTNIGPVGGSLAGLHSGLMMSDREAKEAARLKGQAEGMMAGMRSSLAQGPAVGSPPTYAGGIFRQFPTEENEEPMTTEKLHAAIERSINDSVEAPSAPTVTRPRTERSAEGGDLAPGTDDFQRYGGRPHKQKSYAYNPNTYAWRNTTTSDERTKNVRSTDEAMAGAARSMEPSSYSYKSEYRPDSQSPGEVNVGPMANNMARDPVASTAIVQDPKSGMLAIDKDKGLKVVMGSLASLQHQIDSMKDGRRAKGAQRARPDGSSSHA